MRFLQVRDTESEYVARLRNDAKIAIFESNLIFGIEIN